MCTTAEHLEPQSGFTIHRASALALPEQGFTHGSLEALCLDSPHSVLVTAGILAARPGRERKSSLCPGWVSTRI